MPKFLDAPSWYDDDGNLKTIQGDFRISIGGGYSVSFDVPWVDGANTSSLPSQAYYLVPGILSIARFYHQWTHSLFFGCDRWLSNFVQWDNGPGVDKQRK